MHCILPLAAIAAIAGAAPAQPPASAAQQLPRIPAPAEIEPLTDGLVAKRGQYGLVVGVLAGEQTGFFGFGRSARKSARQLDADSVFEIGSVTKVFTGLLLADAVTSGAVELDDTAASLLPEGERMPRTDDREISLLDLASHHSGLPRLPDNIAPKRVQNPYAEYTPALLYEFLGEYELRREPGALYEYSNLGMGLLGHLLATQAGVDYEILVRQRITAPLGLRDTGIRLSEEQQSRLARGHAQNGMATSNWDLPVLTGAGALRSTPADMLRFLGACTAPPGDAFAALLATSLRPRRKLGSGEQVALGWHISEVHGRELVWHNGATGGYCSFAGFRPDAPLAVVVLCNRQSGSRGRSPGELARAVLALAEAPPE